MLIIICGLQGTGKTTVAKKVALKINGVVLRTDEIRKEIIKNPVYSKEEKDRVYDEMFSRAKGLIKEGRSVVLDATFVKKENRDRAKGISKEFRIIEVVCPEGVARERIRKRVGNKNEANFDNYLKYKRFFEAVDEEHMVVDTSKDVDEQLRELV